MSKWLLQSHVTMLKTRFAHVLKWRKSTEVKFWLSRNLADYWGLHFWEWCPSKFKTYDGSMFFWWVCSAVSHRVLNKGVFNNSFHLRAFICITEFYQLEYKVFRPSKYKVQQYSNKTVHTSFGTLMTLPSSNLNINIK